MKRGWRPGGGQGSKRVFLGGDFEAEAGGRHKAEKPEPRYAASRGMERGGLQTKEGIPVSRGFPTPHLLPQTPPAASTNSCTAASYLKSQKTAKAPGRRPTQRTPRVGRGVLDSRLGRQGSQGIPGAHRSELDGTGV